jgi:hypothetical protein
MKTPALALFLVVLCSAVSAEAQSRQWREATVANITADSADGGVAVLPLGGAVVGIPITRHRVFYHIETDDVTYVLAWVNKRHPLNVTLGGKTKIALDRNGRDARILDDAGKEVKLPIARKIARPTEAVPEHSQQQIRRLPENGNELLVWCGAVDRLSERTAADLDVNLKFGWCAGYLGAIRDAIRVSEKSLVMATSMGVKLTDPPPSIVEIILRDAGMEPAPPKTAQELAVPLSMICIPHEAGSPGQLARVVLKWLRDHPERLHEQVTILTLDALKDAFPCQANAPTKKPDNQ